MLDQLMAHRLLMAAGGGHWQLVRKLIEEYELDPAHQNEGWTAIHWAVGDTDNVEQRTNVVEQRISEFGNSLGKVPTVCKNSCAPDFQKKVL